jgi:hypothetical protein
MAQLDTENLLNNIKSISEVNAEMMKGKGIQGLKDALAILFPVSSMFICRKRIVQTFRTK